MANMSIHILRRIYIYRRRAQGVDPVHVSMSYLRSFRWRKSPRACRTERLMEPMSSRLNCSNSPMSKIAMVTAVYWNSSMPLRSPYGGAGLYRRSGKMPRSHIAPHKEGQTECGNNRGISLVATRWQGSPRGDRHSPELLLRTGGYPARGAVRLQTAAVGNRYDIRGPKTLPTGEKKEHPSLHVLRRSRQSSIRSSRPAALVDRARPVRRTTKYARRYS